MATESETSRKKPRVIVLALGERQVVREQEARLRPFIEQHTDIVLADFEFEKDLSEVDADFAIVLGGDGSILRAAKQMGTNQIPVLGVNLGHLGFLADLSPDELIQYLPDVCSGDCRTVDHLMFRCSISSGGETTCEAMGLNETAIFCGAPFSMLNIDLYVDSDLVTTYSCDGLIVSTPIGSTAHNLSAGGPILRKNLQAFVISPISPHTLTIRPVVDTADRIYELAVAQPNDGTTVVVDGQPLCKLKVGDRIRIERADVSFRMIEVRDHNYYRTLREKLGWRGNLRARNH